MRRSGVRSTTDIRLVNQSLVLELLRDRGPLSRAEVARALGLTRSTVSQITTELLRQRLIREVGTGQSAVGRKPILLELNPTAGIVVGVDLGGPQLLLGAANLAGQVVHRRRLSTFTVPTAREFIDRLSDAIEDLLESAGGPQGLKAVGVATPGIVDVERGVILGASHNLPEWDRLPLADILAERFHVPVVVENDVNAALLGEHRYGHGRDLRNLAFIAVSRGIGGAVMLGGELYRGTRGAAGEIGFWLMGRRHVRRDWRPQGCFEALCSCDAILRRTGRSAEELAARARAGDRAARSEVRRLAEYVGMAAANLVSLLDLEMVVLGGSPIVGELAEAVQRIVDDHAAVQAKVVVSALGDEAMMLGAMELALRRIFPAARLEL